MFCRPIDFFVKLGMRDPSRRERRFNSGEYGVAPSGGEGEGEDGRPEAELRMRSSWFSRNVCWVSFLWMAYVGVSLCHGAESAPTRAERSPFIIKHWTSENDLPQNKVSCLKRTRDGYLWVGTHFGLVRF